jgi:hypothetical protein
MPTTRISRLDFTGYDDLAALLQPMCLDLDPVSIRQIVERLHLCRQEMGLAGPRAAGPC